MPEYKSAKFKDVFDVTLATKGGILRCEGAIPGEKKTGVDVVNINTSKYHKNHHVLSGKRKQIKLLVLRRRLRKQTLVLILPLLCEVLRGGCHRWMKYSSTPDHYIRTLERLHAHTRTITCAHYHSYRYVRQMTAASPVVLGVAMQVKVDDKKQSFHRNIWKANNGCASRYTQKKFFQKKTPILYTVLSTYYYHHTTYYYAKKKK